MSKRFWQATSSLGAVIILGLLTSPLTQAQGVCDCCTDEIVKVCQDLCNKTQADDGYCHPSVLLDGKVSRPENPLNGFSYKFLNFGQPTHWQAEKFRRFMERSREQAKHNYILEWRQHRKGKISDAEMKKARKTYDEALINYHHGISAYMNSKDGARH